MARKLSFSKEEILNTAYKILIEDGMKSITARNVAKELGSSTISIYSNFGSMVNLKNDLSRMAKINFLILQKLNIQTRNF